MEQGSDWNDWKCQEKLLQLAVHLRGRALGEWSERQSFLAAAEALRLQWEGNGSSELSLFTGRKKKFSFQTDKEVGRDISDSLWA